MAAFTAGSARDGVFRRFDVVLGRLDARWGVSLRVAMQR
jgi:hypothetical protein